MKARLLTGVSTAFLLAGSVGMAGLSRADTATYDMTRRYGPYLTATETTVWENRNLSEIEAFICTVGGGWVTDAVGIGVIYDRTPTSFTVQFQCRSGGCKTVRAYFRQNGADIVARADKAALGDTADYGKRLPDSLFTTSLATSDSAEGYGVYGIEALSVDQTVDALPAEADGIVVNGGILQVNVTGDCTVSTPISGNGGMRFHGSGTAIETQHTFDQYVTSANQTLIGNTDVFEIEITSAVFNGGWCRRGEGARPYNVTSNLEAKTMRVQLQNRFGTYNNLYGFIVELSQSGSDVLIKGVSTRQAGDKDEGSDMAGWTGSTASIATSATAAGYGLESISFTRRSLPTVILDGTKGWTGGTVADGCKVRVTGSRLAANTTAKAVNGGTLELAAAGVYNDFPENTFVAETGATIYFKESFAINQKDTLTVLGGAAKLYGTSNVYVNNALFADGAIWFGPILQVGFKNNAYLKTEGADEIGIFSDLRLVANNASRTVTFDTAADIVVHGVLEENSNYPGATLVKQGSAKATFEKGGSITGPLQVEGGTIAFGDDASFGPLVVAGSATVEIAAGKTLAFAASGEREWTAGTRLNLVGEFGQSAQVVRFGTDATGLAKTQLGKIRINGLRCIMDGNGWLHPHGSGFVVEIK